MSTPRQPLENSRRENRDPNMSDGSFVGHQGDITNPFLPTKSHSRPSSPSKRPTLAHAHASSSSSAVKMDVIQGGDWLGGKEVGGTGGGGRKMSGKSLDRFIPTRPPNSSANSSSDTINLSLELSGNFGPAFAPPTASSSTAPHTRILAFTAPPPSSTSASASSHLDAARSTIRQSTLQSGSAGRQQQAVDPKSKRRVPTIPEMVLDAPGFINDYYLNLLSWSCTNKVGIALGDTGYVWDAETGSVGGLHKHDGEGPDITSLSWAPDGSFLAVGNADGDVEIWDADEGRKVRTMRGHRARVAALSWTGATLSSGCRDGSIFHHDVRVADHKVGELRGHRAEVCGLAWRSDGQFLASGGNDNVVNCWDGRVGQSIITDSSGAVTTPKWQKMNHTAAVKAIAWCPWQSSLLATGGGTNDQTIHFWSSTTGARLNSLATPSQVTSLIWSPHSKEILSTHGFPDHNISVWNYPSLTKVYEFPAHDERILCSALSPDGCTVVTGASDENLKFWKIWEQKVGYKAKAVEAHDENVHAGKMKNTGSRIR